MKKHFCSYGGARIIHLMIASLAISLPVARGVLPPKHEVLSNFDKRVAAAPISPEQELAKKHLKTQLPAVKVDFDPAFGTPRFIRVPLGFLSGSNGVGRAISRDVAQVFNPKDPYRPVKAFIKEHAALFGHGAEALDTARVQRESTGFHNGLRTVVWQQQLEGIPVFEANLICNITKNGELVNISSRFLPDIAKSANAGNPNRRAIQSAPPVSAAQAIANALLDANENISVSEISPAETSVAGDGLRPFIIKGNKAYARLVWLPMDRSKLRLAWEVFIKAGAYRESYQSLVDAVTGEVVARRGLTRYISDATYNVYTSDSPSPFSPGHSTPSSAQPSPVGRDLVVTNSLSVLASPNGWINDGDNETLGNNVDGRLDRNSDGQPDGPRPQGNLSRVFDFPLDLTQDPVNYTDAAVVQLFYWLNWYHDRVYELGFTEAAGNYQTTNFDRGGLGDDAIEANAQTGADNPNIRNNAQFSSAPDGVPGEIDMFIFDGPSPDIDADLDGEVVLHEATHGTSQRLVGGGVLISALQTDGMGEGWSDFYALSLLSGDSDDPNAVYAMGGYATFHLDGLTQNYYYGIRHYPYTTDTNKNPFTFKDIDPAQIGSHPGVPLSPIYPFSAGEAGEVHHQGEIWCVTLWEARANLIAKYGGAVGNQLMLQLVTDGMKLGPVNPNFLEARDAIILADQVNNGGTNFVELWRGFAKRGMGSSATSPDSSTTSGVHESFDTPSLSIERIDVAGGNGNGIVDHNECNDLSIVLQNLDVTDATNVQASLSTVTPGVIVTRRLSPYPNISVGNTATNLTAFKLGTTPDFICGTTINLKLVINSNQVSRTNQFNLPSGTNDLPVQFIGADLITIPDNNSAGTNSIVVVSNIFSGIGKVTVSLFLTHTYDSDLSLQLIGPDGTTATLAAKVGSFGDNFGTDCVPETSRTTFDDSATIPIRDGSPPFVGTFEPAQSLSTFIGKLGTNVNGTWQLHIVDDALVDSGTLQCWTLNISPSICTDGGGQCPGVNLIVGAPYDGVTTNGFRFTLSGLPDTAYIIEAASEFPAVSWTPLGTNTTAADGTLTFTDTNSPGIKDRFYRAVTVP